MYYDEFENYYTLGEYETCTDPCAPSYGDYECGFGPDAPSFEEYECGCDYDISDY